MNHQPRDFEVCPSDQAMSCVQAIFPNLVELNLNDNQLSAIHAMPYQAPSSTSPFIWVWPGVTYCIRPLLRTRLHY